MNELDSSKMPLVDVEESREQRDDAGNEVLATDNVLQSVKEEKCFIEEEAPTDSDDPVEVHVKESRSKSSKQVASKRSRVQKSSKTAKKRSKKSIIVSDESDDDLLLVAKEEVMDVVHNPAAIPTVHTCKFCQKDFSSAFILCLHVQIHEKVNSVLNSSQQVQTKNSLPITKHPVVNKNAANNQTCTAILVDDEPNVISLNSEPTVKTEPAGITSRNFVESLKKNLSLAMNKNV